MEIDTDTQMEEGDREGVGEEGPIASYAASFGFSSEALATLLLWPQFAGTTARGARASRAPVRHVSAVGRPRLRRASVTPPLGAARVWAAPHFPGGPRCRTSLVPRR